MDKRGGGGRTHFEWKGADVMRETQVLKDQVLAKITHIRKREGEKKAIYMFEGDAIK